MAGAAAFAHIDDAATIAAIAKKHFDAHHIPVNLSSQKTAVLVPADSSFWRDARLQSMFRSLSITAQSTTKAFVVLGADVSDEQNSFLEKYAVKQEDFFRLLNRLDIHPSILFSILRTCGNPRLLYLCSTTPPTPKLLSVAGTFDECCRRLLNGPSLLKGRLREISNSCTISLALVSFNTRRRRTSSISNLFKETALTSRTSPLDSLLNTTLYQFSGARLRMSVRVGFSGMVVLMNCLLLSSPSHSA